MIQSSFSDDKNVNNKLHNNWLPVCAVLLKNESRAYGKNLYSTFQKLKFIVSIARTMSVFERGFITHMFEFEIGHLPFSDWYWFVLMESFLSPGH